MPAPQVKFPTRGSPLEILAWYVEHQDVELSDPTFCFDLGSYTAPELREIANQLFDYAEQCE